MLGYRASERPSGYRRSPYQNNKKSIIKRIFKVRNKAPGMVVHAFHPSTREAKAGRPT